MVLCRTIRQLCNREHLTQDELCRRLGCTRDVLQGRLTRELVQAMEWAFGFPCAGALEESRAGSALESAACVSMRGASGGRREAVPFGGVRRAAAGGEFPPEPFVRFLDGRSVREVAAWAARFPLREVEVRISASRDLCVATPGHPGASLGRIRAVMRFMGVGSVAGFENYYAAALGTVHPLAYAAWIRLGELRVPRGEREFVLDPYAVRNNLDFLRRNVFLRGQGLRDAIREALDNCGIALVEVPPLVVAPFPTSACYWVGTQPVVQIPSVRMPDSRLLEAVFHAVAHIAFHPVRTMCLEAPRLPGPMEAGRLSMECEATRYAREMLLGEADECELICSGHFEDPHCIAYFARTFRVRPGILVERLQQQGKLAANTPLNRLKQVS